jgi:hypothetical protein
MDRLGLLICAHKKDVIRILFMLVFSSLLTGCPLKVETTETVGIDVLFWEAYRDPVGFDVYLASQTLDSRVSDCFRHYSDSAFSDEYAKLLECSVILESTPPWNDCHAEAEAFHNQGVMLNDLSLTIDGAVNFSETGSYSYLVLAKSLVTDTDWNILVDAVDEITPPLYCKYKEEKWIWE